MPQNQQAIQDPNYTPIDPQKNFLGFVSANKEAIQRMPPDKQLKFVDMLFRRFALPKYQAVNKQKPLDSDEVSRLRLQFAARLLGIPMDQETILKDEKNEAGTLKKGAAALEGAGAGVLGGIKSISDLSQKIDKHLGPIGDIASYVHGKIGDAARKAEGKAYEDASSISPGIASASAAVGHQIPAAIATHGVESVLPTAAKTAPLAIKALSSGARGAAGGATFEASRPGGDPKSGAAWGGVLGAAFPMIGKLFGFGRGTTAKVAEAVGTGEGAPAAKATPTESSTSLSDVKNAVSKNNFGKSFEELTSDEKTKIPSLMKEEIEKQKAIKIANIKATRAAIKAGREAEETAKRAAKAKEATEKAAAQASKRAEGGSKVVQATAAKAAEENPAASKLMQEEKRVRPQGPPPAGTPERRAAYAKVTQAENLRHLEGELAKETDPVRKKSIQESIDAMKELMTTKVPEGETGPKVRAKAGAPASPAQQAADRERIASKRELSKKEEFGAALEKHAQAMAGRHTSASLGIMHVPELEATVKEMPEGEYMLKTLQKAKRAYKWSDEIYAESLKEWLLNQFEKK
jgi:hypothetical protein